MVQVASAEFKKLSIRRMKDVRKVIRKNRKNPEQREQLKICNEVIREKQQSTMVQTNKTLIERLLNFLRRKKKNAGSK